MWQMISIHLMLWFFNDLTYEQIAEQLISIHLMLWFFPQQTLIQMHQTYFNTSNVMVLQSLDYWSSSTDWHFNTSNVMVLLPPLGSSPLHIMISIHLMLWFFLRKFNKQVFKGSISIHLMLWFFLTSQEIAEWVERFQYI